MASFSLRSKENIVKSNINQNDMENRGGFRSNAGRKKRTGIRKKGFTVCISDETRNKLTYLKGKGVKIGVEFERLVNGLVSDYER